jgi:hypothetical protein
VETEGRRRDGGRTGLPSGVSLPEVLASLGILALLIAFSAPIVAETAARERLRAAGRETALLLRGLRYRAVAERTSFGLRFTRAGEGWSYTLYRDGNGNGIRTTDIAAGRDRFLEGPSDPGARHEGIRFGLPAAPIPEIPPGTGTVPNPGDPIKVGTSDIVSFSPSGSMSGGTLYLTDGRRVAGVVLYGPTGRIRIFLYESARGRWSGP